MEIKFCDLSKAFGKFFKTIIEYATQGPMSYSTEKEKLEYLYNSVAGLEWAMISLMQCNSHEPRRNFHQLFFALDTVCLQEQRRSTFNTLASSDSTNIFWGAQKTYGSPRAEFKSPSMNVYHEKDISNQLCYDCSELENFNVQCSKSKYFFLKT